MKKSITIKIKTFRERKKKYILNPLLGGTEVATSWRLWQCERVGGLRLEWRLATVRCGLGMQTGRGGAGIGATIPIPIWKINPHPQPRGGYNFFPRPLPDGFVPNTIPAPPPIWVSIPV